jgi:LuxR family maltose regulon positive regulatory protein
VLADARADPDAARRRLTTAVVAAEPEGVVRPFLDEGPPMAALLAALRDLPPRAEAFVAALLTRLPGSSPAVRRGLPVEPLTTREVEVLALLAAGRSNAGIAGALFVELSTVKTHLIHVYAKLGVHSRVEAILRARELHLLR